LRKAKLGRKTKETNISIEVDLEGKGRSEINTSIGFFDHMLELFSKHSLVDLTIEAKGDLHIDEHHTVEDVGIVLGQVFKKALGDKKGIKRYGFFSLPMDEALANVSMDFGGRPWLAFNVEFKREKVGDFSTELVEDFFQAFAINAEANVHISILYGRNTHHKIEAIFKCFARALRIACEKDERVQDVVPSTKGVL